MRFAPFGLALLLACALDSPAAANLPLKRSTGSSPVQFSSAILVENGSPICFVEPAKIVSPFLHSNGEHEQIAALLPRCSFEQTAQVTNFVETGFRNMQFAFLPPIIVPAIFCIGSAFVTAFVGYPMFRSGSTNLAISGAFATAMMAATLASMRGHVIGICAGAGAMISVLLFYETPPLRGPPVEIGPNLAR